MNITEIMMENNLLVNRNIVWYLAIVLSVLLRFVDSDY